jgi:hypothetical protein
VVAQVLRDLGPVPALEELAGELSGGGLRPLREEAPDRAEWDRAAAPHLGRRWLDLPFYFAEAFFYRRLLEATGYFGPGGRDPFAGPKDHEWAPDQAPRRCAELLAGGPGLRALVLASLWGNRGDLSHDVARALGSYHGQDSDLLVDDSSLAFADRRAEVVLIADNAGTELLMDLALADHLLASGRVERMTLHLKDHPIFVSDATPGDLGHGLEALASGDHPAAALARRLARWRSDGRLAVETDPFYTSSRFYPELPRSLRQRLAVDLVILKGDANYRRLCSDAHWLPETPFETVVESFPAPLVVLRTMKSELVVGLPSGLAEREAAADPRWMVRGRRGLIQARL